MVAGEGTVGQQNGVSGQRPPNRETTAAPAESAAEARQPKRHSPLSTTTTSPGRRVWNTASPSPVRQIEIMSSSPGNTGEVNRASIDLNRAGSLSHSAPSSPRPVNPYVQSPWRMGRSKPAAVAKDG